MLCEISRHSYVFVPNVSHRSPRSPFDGKLNMENAGVTTDYCDGNKAAMSDEVNAFCMPAEMCQAYCNAIDNCVSFDMHDSSPRCYLNIGTDTPCTTTIITANADANIANRESDTADWSLFVKYERPTRDAPRLVALNKCKAADVRCYQADNHLQNRASDGMTEGKCDLKPSVLDASLCAASTYFAGLTPICPSNYTLGANDSGGNACSGLTPCGNPEYACVRANRDCPVGHEYNSSSGCSSSAPCGATGNCRPELWQCHDDGTPGNVCNDGNGACSAATPNDHPLGHIIPGWAAAADGVPAELALLDGFKPKYFKEAFNWMHHNNLRCSADGCCMSEKKTTYTTSMADLSSSTSGFHAAQLETYLQQTQCKDVTMAECLAKGPTLLSHRSNLFHFREITYDKTSKQCTFLSSCYESSSSSAVHYNTTVNTTLPIVMRYAHWNKVQTSTVAGKSFVFKNDKGWTGIVHQNVAITANMHAVNTSAFPIIMEATGVSSPAACHTTCTGMDGCRAYMWCASNSKCM